jgi:hypothetical protein
MEKIMSKSNDVSTLDHRSLADSELDAVTGGWSLSGIPGAAAPAETTPWNWRKMIVDGALKEPVY